MNRHKTLISGVYIKRPEERQVERVNLLFFLKHGVLNIPEYDFKFIINGEPPDTPIPTKPNVSVINRKNSGWDFGAWGASLKSVDVNKYDHFIFINDTARGPFVPHYVPSCMDWVQMFTSRLSDTVKLVGPTINEKHCGRSERHIQSMCFGTDRVGLNVLIKAGIFNPSMNTKLRPDVQKALLIAQHEVRMSKVIEHAGFKLESNQLCYVGGDTPSVDPHNIDTYFGTTLNPLETMFVKAGRINNGVTKNYTRWMMSKS